MWILIRLIFCGDVSGKNILSQWAKSYESQSSLKNRMIVDKLYPDNQRELVVMDSMFDH